MKPAQSTISEPGTSGKRPPGRESISVAELCGISGFDQSWLHRLAKRGYFPESREGAYPFRESVRGLLDYLRGTKSRLSQLRERKLKAEIAIQAVKLKELRARYVPRTKVARDLEETNRMLRRIWEPILTKAWPAEAVGKTQIGLIELGRATTDRICDEFRNQKAHEEKPDRRRN